MDRATRVVLVTGAAGMLGGELVRCAPGGVRAVGVDREQADLADAGQVARLFDALGPLDAVIHAAAWTDVDGAESEPDRARRDNVGATRELAAACARTGIPLQLISTDFVFDGRARRPYREEDEPAPLGVYGRTKLEAERAARAAHPSGARIVRTAWLYGPGGAHFPATVLRLARERGSLRVVDDQRGSPTSTHALAPALWGLLFLPGPEVVHAACEGDCSRYEWARAILELAGLRDVRLEPCRTADFPRPAPRPAWSVLDCGRLRGLLGRSLPHWRDALKRYLAAEQR